MSLLFILSANPSDHKFRIFILQPNPHSPLSTDSSLLSREKPPSDPDSFTGLLARFSSNKTLPGLAVLRSSTQADVNSSLCYTPVILSEPHEVRQFWALWSLRDLQAHLYHLEKGKIWVQVEASTYLTEPEQSHGAPHYLPTQHSVSECPTTRLYFAVFIDCEGSAVLAIGSLRHSRRMNWGKKSQTYTSPRTEQVWQGTELQM